MSKYYYETSVQHLLAELKRIDLLIMAEVDISRQQVSSEVNLMKMYGISENEIDLLMQEAIAAIRDVTVECPRLNDQVGQLLKQQKNDIADRKSESIVRNIPLRLERLRELFDLSPDEVDILLISLAPEICNKYQRFFAYLQDDKNQIRPSVDLVLRLLQVPFHSDCIRLRKYALFADQAPLVQTNLVYLEDDAHRPGQPLLNRIVKTDERIRDYLLGSDDVARELDSYATCHAPRLSLDDLLIKHGFKTHMLSLVRNMEPEQECMILYLQGGYGVGKQAVAEAMCRSAGLNLLVADLKPLVKLKPAEFRHNLSKLVREAELQTAALVLNDFDMLLPGQPGEKSKARENAPTQHDGLVHTLFTILAGRIGLFFFYRKCGVGTQGFVGQVLIFSLAHTETGYPGKGAVVEVISAGVPAICG